MRLHYSSSNGFAVRIKYMMDKEEQAYILSIQHMLARNKKRKMQIAVQPQHSAVNATESFKNDFVISRPMKKTLSKPVCGT